MAGKKIAFLALLDRPDETCQNEDMRYKNSYQVYALISLLGLFLSGYLLFTKNWPHYQAAKASLDWQKTDGMIIRSKIVNQRGNELETKRLTYKLSLSYSYFVDKKAYESSQIFVTGEGYTSGLLLNAKKYHESYPQGKTVTVFVDPKNPQNAVLEPGPNEKISQYFYLNVLGLVLSGVLSLFILYRLIVIKK